MTSTDTCPTTGYHPSICGCEYHLTEAGIRLLGEDADDSGAVSVGADWLPF